MTRRFGGSLILLFSLAVVAVIAAAVWPVPSRPSDRRLVIRETSQQDIIQAEHDGQQFAVRATSPVLAGILPHHMLVSPLVEAFFLGLPATPVPRRVVVIGPDHENRGQADLTTTTRSWSSVAGEIETDAEFSRRLVQNTSVVVDDALAEREHGVNDVLPFIHRRWPTTRVVTITLKYASTPSELQSLAAFLSQNLGARDLLLASVDFSHYKNSEMAQADDVKSLAAIRAIDPIAAMTIPVDSPPAISVLLRYVQANKLKLQELVHTNSAEYLNDPTLQSTTSYLTAYFTGK